MKGRISRKKARVAIVLMVAACALVLLGVIADFKPCMLVGVILLLIALCLLPWKCPNCGKRCKLTPQWSEYGSTRCVHCGIRVAYDDEPDEAVEEPSLR